MNVASLDLCKELYELSGWIDTDDFWWNGKVYDKHSENDGAKWARDTSKYPSYSPAYDLGYLLRKLPPYIATYGDDGDDCLFHLRPDFDGTEWTAGYVKGDHYLHMAMADTPEDACAKLCIELFKQGVLK